MFQSEVCLKFTCQAIVTIMWNIVVLVRFTNFLGIPQIKHYFVQYISVDIVKCQFEVHEYFMDISAEFPAFLWYLVGPK